MNFISKYGVFNENKIFEIKSCFFGIKIKKYIIPFKY